MNGSGQMEIEALKTFIAVVEEKNFTLAGKRRLLSQPSISLHIKHLEDEFQTRLIDRSPKHLRVTAAGDLLYRRAKQILELMDKTTEDIYALQHRITGTIKIGASYTIGEYILPKLLSDFHQQYPDIGLEVSVDNTEKVASAVRMLQLDIGFIEGSVDATDLVVTPFMEDEMVLVASESYIQSRPDFQLASLGEETWITREKGSGTREFMEHFFQTQGIAPKKVVMISSNMGVKEAVVQGLGLSILSHWVVRQEVNLGRIRILPTKNKLNRMLSYVLPSNIEGTKAAEVFIYHLGNRLSL